MSMAKGCGFLATSVLSIILLVISSVACKGKEDRNYKKEYCQQDIILSGKYTGPYEGNGPLKSNLKITHVMKGPSDMQNVVEIYDVNHRCDYNPEYANVEEFIITVNDYNGQLQCYSSHTWKDSRLKELEALEDISINDCK